MKHHLNLDAYPFSIRPLAPDEGTGCLIGFPDLPGIISGGKTHQAAIVNGRGALNAALLTLKELVDQIPPNASPSTLWSVR